jgi:hypothetical protein
MRQGAPVIGSERQQRMVERGQEDERLRGDLPDEAAVALVEWAGQRAAAAAAETTRSDRDVEAEVQGIRAAAYAAARAGETDPRRLLAQAETSLAQRRVPTESSPPSEPTASAQQTQRHPETSSHCRSNSHPRRIAGIRSPAS